MHTSTTSGHNNGQMGANASGSAMKGLYWGRQKVLIMTLPLAATFQLTVMKNVQPHSLSITLCGTVVK
eukprot:1117695-Amphidinium_carterae.1